MRFRISEWERLWKLLRFPLPYTHYVYTEGSLYYGKNAFGELLYGGSGNAGGVSGSDPFAIINALTNTANRKIFVKDGLYTAISATPSINLVNDNVSLEGELLNWGTRFKSSLGYPIMTIGDAAYYTEDIAIKKIGFDLFGTTTEGISAKNLWKATFRDCYFRGYHWWMGGETKYTYAIKLDGTGGYCGWVKIINCDIGNFAKGIAFVGTEAQCKATTITRGLVAYCDIGIDADCGDTAEIFNIDIHGNAVGIRVNYSFNKITDVRFEANTNDITLTAASSANRISGGSPTTISDLGTNNRIEGITYPWFKTENRGHETGTGLQQTIAHGCKFTPTYDQVFLSERTTGGALAKQTAAPDATNIYVTAIVDKDFIWWVRHSP